MKTSKLTGSTIAFLALLFGAFVAFVALTEFHQQEDQLTIGWFVIWTGWLSAISAIIAAIMTLTKHKLTRFLAVLAAASAIPLTVFAVHPDLWCAFTECSKILNEAPLQWSGLLILLPMAAAAFLISSEISE